MQRETILRYDRPEFCVLAHLLIATMLLARVMVFVPLLGFCLYWAYVTHV